MNTVSMLYVLICVCVVAVACPTFAAPAGEKPAECAKALENPFFAMATNFNDANHKTPARRAETLKALGYVGGDMLGFRGAADMVKAFEARGLRMFGAYGTVPVDANWEPTEDMKGAIKALKGRNAWLLISMRHKSLKYSDPAGDEAAVAAIRRLADLAEPDGVRVVLYPHSRFWLERAEDAVRVARKTGRDNVGAAFNLCHFLQVDGDESKLTGLLKDSMDKLAVVTINGADSGAKGWKQLIQPLGRGTFDNAGLLRTLHELGYKGAIGLQGYGIKGDSRKLLGESMAAWKRLSAEATSPRISLIGKDLGAFREPLGDWVIAGEAALDPSNERKLTWEKGTGVAVNGPRGRTRHLVTKAEHGDGRAHIEFMVPKGSNSGVYFQGRYEIQVFDSFGVKEPRHSDCGGIYQRWKNRKGFEGRAPRVNASTAPGTWQTFDVWFRAPRFDKDGKKIADACFIKVLHNGKLVHENESLSGPTRSPLLNDEKPTGPIMLQGDHGPVAYRNCWFVKLP